MQKNDNSKKNKLHPYTLIVFLVFAAFAGWFFYTEQPIAGVIFAIFSFPFLRSMLGF